MDELTIISELGDDADLLLAPDDWLENQRISLQQRMSLLADELDGVLNAQRLKTRLQQRNMVAVRHIEQCEGMPADIAIRICPLSDAIAELENERINKAIPPGLADDNADQQLIIWERDGYDVEASRKLKKKKQKA